MHESQRRLCFKGVLLLITLRKDTQQNVDTVKPAPRQGRERTARGLSIIGRSKRPANEGHEPWTVGFNCSTRHPRESYKKHWKIAAECALYLGKTI